MSDNGKGYKPDFTILEQYPVDGWKWPKIAVYVPMERSWTMADKCWPRINEIARCGVRFFYNPAGITAVVRQRVAEGFLKTEYTHLLMLDSDQLWPINIVQHMAKWVIQKPERMIVASLNFNRRKPYSPMAWMRSEDGALMQLVDWPKGIIEGVDLVATACILINREVFGTLERPWFKYDTTGIQDAKENFVHPTEDIYFCKKARAAGFRIDLDTTIHAPHLSEDWVDEQKYRDYLAAHPEEFEDEPEPEIIR